MLSVDPAQHEVNGIRLGRCPACKRELNEHLSSGKQPRAVSGKIDVVNGRCWSYGEPAPQKFSWVQMSELLTEEEYRAKYTDQPPPLEPCPGCGGRLNHHSSYQRGLGEEGIALVNPLPIYRGLCTNDDCPVVTVTHFPCFVTPYEVAPTALREKVVRAHVAGRSWAALEDESRYSAATLRRWTAEVKERAAEVTVGLLAVRQRLLAQAPAGIPAGPDGCVTITADPLRTMFRVIDAVAGLLAGRHRWREGMPGLALPRALSPPGASPLPVWA